MRARRSDAGAHLGAALRRPRQHEVGGRDRRHFDLQIDAVEQGPGDARLVAFDATAALAAGIARLAGAAAAAWVHRGDELNARRVGDAVIGARDHRLAGLQRLAQRVEHLRGWNSGSSSRNSTPRCASATSPGRGRVPPPTSAAMLAE